MLPLGIDTCFSKVSVTKDPLPSHHTNQKGVLTSFYLRENTLKWGWGCVEGTEAILQEHAICNFSVQHFRFPASYAYFEGLGGFSVTITTEARGKSMGPSKSLLWLLI